MPCPTSQELKSFLAGQLSEESFETIAGHLESCSSCIETLDVLETGDSLDEQILQEQPETYSWAESLGARQLTQRLLNRESIADDHLGPDAIGRIKIVRYLASGTFGRVFVGWDDELERHVAVKLPRAGMYLDDDAREEIRREARQAAKVEHPGIVPIYDIGTNESGDVYIISGFVDGCDLNEWRATQSPSFNDSIRMTIKIAEIVAFAHRHQLVHRDIKPGNILIDKDGNPHLVDFGLSTNFVPTGERSSQGLVGTPAYLPPDYLEYVHPPVDPRGDLYSLGVVLYELLTGSRPYDLEPDSWQMTLLTADPVRPRKRNWRVPRRLESICLKAIHRDPRKRFKTAEEFIKRLEQSLGKSSRVIQSGTLRFRDFRKLSKIVVLGATLLISVTMIWGKSGFLGQGKTDSFFIPQFPQAPESMEVQGLQPVPIQIQTKPSGALVAIVPLDQRDWTPEDDRIVQTNETTPVEARLKPGDYLVEVMIPGFGFHQVIRRVEFSQNASVESPRVLPPINIPQTDLESHDLVRIPSGNFISGQPLRPQSRTVHDFLIQREEPTFADYQRVMGELTPAMKKQLENSRQTDLDQPVSSLTFHEALAFAEASGLRLLTDAEWEYVASNGGTTTYPWGDQFPDVSSWGELKAYDETINPSHSPVAGLYSGSMEWVATPSPQNGDATRNGDFFLVKGGVFHIKRGATLDSIRNSSKKKLLDFGVSWSDASVADESYPLLGVRFGRDLEPRYLKSVQLTSN